jgi:putative membrane protein
MQSAALAANLGLYNGFLAAGLIWSLMRKADPAQIKIFVLACVVFAGVFGGITAKTSILFVQGLPALLALMLVLASQRKST